MAALVAQRNVDEAFGEIALVAVGDRVALEARSRRRSPTWIGLVGDDADRAGLRARAVQRALRARQRFDARDVVHVDVERALDRGDRLLVEILADAGLRTGVVAVVAAAAPRMKTRAKPGPADWYDTLGRNFT